MSSTTSGTDESRGIDESKSGTDEALTTTDVPHLPSLHQLPPPSTSQDSDPSLPPPTPPLPGPGLAVRVAAAEGLSVAD